MEGVYRVWWEVYDNDFKYAYDDDVVLWALSEEDAIERAVHYINDNRQYKLSDIDRITPIKLD